MFAALLVTTALSLGASYMQQEKAEEQQEQQQQRAEAKQRQQRIVDRNKAIEQRRRALQGFTQVTTPTTAPGQSTGASDLLAPSSVQRSNVSGLIIPSA